MLELNTVIKALEDQDFLQGNSQIEDIVAQYPYFSVGHSLRAKHHKLNNSSQAEQAITDAAIYSLNRTYLRYFLATQQAPSPQAQDDFTQQPTTETHSAAQVAEDANQTATNSYQGIAQHQTPAINDAYVDATQVNQPTIEDEPQAEQPKPPIEQQAQPDPIQQETAQEESLSQPLANENKADQTEADKDIENTPTQHPETPNSTNHPPTDKPTEQHYDNYFEELLSGHQPDNDNPDQDYPSGGVPHNHSAIYEQKSMPNQSGSNTIAQRQSWQSPIAQADTDTEAPKHEDEIKEDEIQKNLKLLAENKRKFLGQLEQTLNQQQEEKNTKKKKKNKKKDNTTASIANEENPVELVELINPEFGQDHLMFLPNETPTNNFFMENAANKDENQLEWQHKLLDRFIEVELNKAAEAKATVKKPMPKKDEPQTDLSAISTTTHEIVSENMANILLAQGDKQGALKIYHKLKLKFPDKNDYFAKLIENLS